MIEGPLPSQLVELLTQRHLHEPFPASAIGDLLAVLGHVRLDPGEVLLRQGEAGDDLYIVLRGRLDVRVEHEDGSATAVDAIGAGGVAGEMALLTGHHRTATVVAAEPVDAARLSRGDFEVLARKHPQALNEFLRRVLPRLRRNQLVRVLSELFGELDARALQDLEEHLDWVHLPGGVELFREGDTGNDVFVVINGRLRVVAADGDGGERVLEEVGRRGAVGEIALLTGEPRAATVYAVRDSDLLRLSKDAFDTLLDRHPRAMMQIARAAAWRLRRSAQSPARGGAAPTTFAVVPAAPGVPFAELARALGAALQDGGSTLCLDSAGVDRLLGNPGIAQSGQGTVVHESLVAWLSGIEREHRHLVLVADPGPTPWTRRCLRQADRVLVVARAGDDPAPGEVETGLAGMGLKARVELVLLQPDSIARPSGTGRWLAAREVAAHHHVRLGSAADLRRLARRVSGRAVGLVLGGGGSRGFAHIGVLRVLAEEGVEIDIVGGTSIGAMISAAHAFGVTSEEMMRLARTFASPAKLLDRTLPITSLMAGRKVTALYRDLFHEAAIEDLWIPLFAVSSGLSRADAVVHRTGPIWKAVRASTAIPAIFPPLLGEEDEVLVDGNVMNNMPLDVMRELCEGGTVIGVNPMPTRDKRKPYRFGPSLSGWEALRGRLKLFGSRTRAPSILGSVMRATEINSANRMRQPAFRALADVLIEPPLESYPILAFDQYQPIIDIGYRSARESIAAWRARTAPAG